MMGHQSFYATAAQVIPVLWVILLVELRFFGGEPKRGYFSMEADDRHRKTPLVMVILICTVGFLLWTAEGAALRALLTEKDSAGGRRIIELALLFGTLYVFLMPLQPWFEALLERTPLERGRQWIWKRLRVGPYTRQKDEDD